MTERPISILFAALLLAAACGQNESSSDASAATPENAGSTAVATDSAAPASPVGPADFSESDLDLYERAFVKEIEIVKAAQQRALDAKTPAERAAAAQAGWEDQSIPAAAAAAAVSEGRYRITRNAVHDVFETLDFQGKIDGPLSMDMERASAEVRERLARDPFEALTPAAAAALRARMDRLVPVWIEYVNLTAVAG